MLCDRVPDRLGDGLLLRTLNFAQHLKQRHDIDVLSYRYGADHSPLDQPWCRRSWSVPRPSRPLAGSWLSKLGNWRSDSLYPPSAELRRLLDTEIDPGQYDVVWDAGAVLFQHLPPRWAAVPVVADLVDDMVLTYQRAMRRAPRLGDRVRLWKTAVVFARFQRDQLRRASVCTVVSDEDAASFRRVSPRVPVTVVANGVDASYFCPDDLPQRPGRLVFEGMMAFGPNEEAALFLVREVMPLVWDVRPDATVALVGRKPTAAVRALAGERVLVTGDVDDVRPFVREAQLFVCPLQSGAGIKNKLLQAWAMRKAVVATSVSVGGLNAIDGEHLVVRDSAPEFARAIVALLADAEARHRLALAGHRVALERFEWRAMAEAFERLLAGAVATPTGQR